MPRRRSNIKSSLLSFIQKPPNIFKTKQYESTKRFNQL
ncbi:hypothetical protein B4123_0054 [Bacillus paralicheniformis]|nr:hypothetical protein B4123_0054 [Bacillus paralicheniformis]